MRVLACIITSGSADLSGKNKGGRVNGEHKGQSCHNWHGL